MIMMTNIQTPSASRRAALELDAIAAAKNGSNDVVVSDMTDRRSYIESLGNEGVSGTSFEERSKNKEVF